MIISAPKEIKNRENRVSLIPAGVKALVAAGHKVLIEKGAGLGSGIPDEAYQRAGAEIVKSTEQAWGADLVVKVKEPLPDEYRYLRENQCLFTFLHLAAEKELTLELLRRRVNAIAYETIQENDGSLPLLRPMSEVAGRMAVQVGAFYLQSSWQDESSGKGILISGLPGVMPARVAILGGGVAGSNAASVALGMGAMVTLIDQDVRRLEYLEHIFKGRLITLMSNIDNIEESVTKSDLFIGAVLLPGAKAPKLVTRRMISQMERGSVVVDISVDQGGCVETCRPTSHDNPTFLVDGVVHYCVTNMPGAVARSSTFALTNVTQKYIHMLSDRGIESAVRENLALRRGLNTYQGKLVHEMIGKAHNLPHTQADL